jgi:hypothetical protein
MTSSAPQALRRIVGHVEQLSSEQDPAAALRLGVMRRRAEVRLAAAVGELTAAAQARDAPAELRALAAAVRAGRVTWEQCVLGKADDLPEVRAFYGAAGEDQRPTHDDEDDDMGQFPFRD